MGHLDCLHYLLLRGASATARNAEGDGPVDIAATRKHYSCLTLLRRHLNYSVRSESHSVRRLAAPVGTKAAPPRSVESSSTHNTVLEVGLSTTSESDPFYGTGSSSDPLVGAFHGTPTSSVVAGPEQATA